MNEQIIKLKMQSDTLNRCIGFLNDGYYLQNQYTWSDSWSFWLRHMNNNNNIIITWNNHGVIVRKEGKVIFMKAKEEYSSVG